MEDCVDDVLHLLPVVRAAMRRVPEFSHLDEMEFDFESIWQLRQVALTEKGRIHWRAFPLGQLLFLALAESQNWYCCYCGVPMTNDGNKRDNRYATIEHVRTIHDGGSDHPDNLAIACNRCNTERKNHPVQWYLRRVKPYYAPKTLSL